MIWHCKLFFFGALWKSALKTRQSLNLSIHHSLRRGHYRRECSILIVMSLFELGPICVTGETKPVLRDESLPLVLRTPLLTERSKSSSLLKLRERKLWVYEYGHICSSLSPPRQYYRQLCWGKTAWLTEIEVRGQYQGANRHKLSLYQLAVEFHWKYKDIVIIAVHTTCQGTN